MDNDKLNDEQLHIIEHTIKNGIYCGGSDNMDKLCKIGLMEYAGKNSFVPDPYYQVTQKGKEYII